MSDGIWKMAEDGERRVQGGGLVPYEVTDKVARAIAAGNRWPLDWRDRTEEELMEWPTDPQSTPGDRIDNLRRALDEDISNQLARLSFRGARRAMAAITWLIEAEENPEQRPSVDLGAFVAQDHELDEVEEAARVAFTPRRLRSAAKGGKGQGPADEDPRKRTT